MRLIFNLAIVLKEGQDIMELLKPYLRISEISLEEGIKQHKNFISGIIIGDIDEEYVENNILVLDNKEGSCVNFAKIKEVNWMKIEKNENEKLKDMDISKEYKRIALEEFFPFTNAIITPDGKWHGMLPLNLISVGFTDNKMFKEYAKKYYSEYIKPYENDGKIIILTCNV